MPFPSLADASSLAQAITPVLVLMVLIFTVRAGVQNKRTDILMECHRRFDTLAVERAGLVKRLRSAPTTGADADLLLDLYVWAERFWSLQFDEYEWWRRGYIDDDIFRYWMKSRNRDFTKARADAASGHASFETYAFTDGLTRLRDLWVRESTRSDFLSFIERMKGDSEEVSAALRDCRPGLHRRWGFW